MPLSVVLYFWNDRKPQKMNFFLSVVTKIKIEQHLDNPSCVVCLDRFFFFKAFTEHKNHIMTQHVIL